MMGKFALIFFLFQLVYDYILSPYTQIDAALINLIIYQTESLLQFLGYPLLEQSGEFAFHTGIANTSGVIIGGPCDGLSLFILYATFILSFKGKWWVKSIWTIAGILLIHFLNILRVTALALIVLYAPDQLDFHHSYTFTLIIYVIIFALWMLRVKSYTKVKSAQ